MLFLWCRSIGDFEHSDWSIFKNHWRHCRGKFIKVVILLTTFLTLSLHPLPDCLSPSFLALIPLYLPFLPLNPPPHYLSPSFLPILLLTTSLPHSSSSLPLSLLALLFLLPLSLLPLNSPHYFSSLIHLHPLPHYLSSFFLSILLLTTSLSHSSPQ